MNERENLEAARAKLESEREVLRTATERHAAATAELAELERRRLRVARDPVAHGEARKAEAAAREEVDRLASLIREVQPAAIASAENALQSAQWLVSSADFAATVERMRPAYDQAIEAAAAHWASISALAALIAEADAHSEAMAKTGAPAPRLAREFVRTAGHLASMGLPKEHGLTEHRDQGALHRGRDTIVTAIAARMRELLKLPENDTGGSYAPARQVLDMLAGRYRKTLAEYARRATGGTDHAA